MSAVLNFQAQLEIHYCPNCSMSFALPPRFIKERREGGASFYCPSGHKMSFHESESDKLRKQLEAEKRSVEWLRQSARVKDSQLKGARIQIGKVKAKLQRAETRIAHGVCPCCNRSFQNLRRHMNTKHPDYATTE